MNPQVAAADAGWGRSIARVHGWFYFATGVWPLIHGNSFQQVTGFKADFWLAQTVGLLLAITGSALIMAARANRITREIVFIAVMQAAALIAIDVYCMPQPRTTWVYSLDAVAEAGLLVAWFFAWRKSRRAA